MLGRIFARLGHYYPWASPGYLLDHMTVEQVFYYYELMVWELTGEPPAEYADRFHKSERWKAYPELAPASGKKARVVSR